MDVSGSLDDARRGAGRHGGCMAAGCTSPSGIRCNYVDWKRTHCRTTWCFAHWALVRGRPYCRRHATIIEALDGDSAVGGLPDVNNRAASLAGWMGKELEAPVRTALWAVAPDRARLISEPLRPALSPGSGRRWQRAWSLADESGVLSRVCIEVEEHDDCEVVARVDGEVIGQGIPPWVRHNVRASEIERRNFRVAIARSVEVVLTGGELASAF